MPSPRAWPSWAIAVDWASRQHRVTHISVQRKGIDMNRATVSIAASAILAATTAVLAPAAASAAGGALAGTWTSVDNDGSNQTLEIRGAGRTAYAMAYVDESATSVCGGNPAQLSGPGYADGSDVLMVASLVCLPGGNALRTRLTIFFAYDAGADTLTDDFGIVWHRAG